MCAAALLANGEQGPAMKGFRLLLLFVFFFEVLLGWIGWFSMLPTLLSLSSLLRSLSMLVTEVSESSLPLYRRFLLECLLLRFDDRRAKMASVMQSVLLIVGLLLKFLMLLPEGRVREGGSK